jgi:hypothetical protein
MNELCDLKVHINGHHTLYLHQARTTCQLNSSSSEASEFQESLTFFFLPLN